MSRPLQPADPSRLGPFRLSGRLRESAAGIVYSGEDPYGIRVSVALLTKGAAGDAAARDRFRAAITREMPASTGVPPVPRNWASGATAPLIAAEPNSPAPWVATTHDPDRPGAERFLDPVMFQGGGQARGPRFEPYWIDARDPAARLPGLGGPRVRDRGLIAAIVSLAILLMLLALALLLLFSCEPSSRKPPPSPSPTQTRPSPSPTPSPTPSSPSPSPSKKKSPSPSPSGTGEGNPV